MPGKFGRYKTKPQSISAYNKEIAKLEQESERRKSIAAKFEAGESMSDEDFMIGMNPPTEIESGPQGPQKTTGDRAERKMREQYAATEEKYALQKLNAGEITDIQYNNYIDTLDNYVMGDLTFVPKADF